MTFVQLQNDVMERMGLTHTDSRTRVKRFLNQRLRRLVTNLGLGRLGRRSTITFVTVATTKTYTPSTLIKPFSVIYTAGNLVLEELTQAQLRALDADDSQTGAPRAFVVVAYGATTVTLRIWPTPDAVYTLTVDGLITGTDLSADGDVPAFPEDYHDVLIFGAEADELEKMEKYDLAAKKEAAYEKRMRELRYFLAKSAYLGVQPGTSPITLPHEPQWTDG